MKIDSFRRLYIHALKDLYNAENQIAKALPIMMGASSNKKLKQAFEKHLKETRRQAERLEKIFEALEFNPGGHKCVAMEGIIKEGKELIEMAEGDPSILDAGLIASAQKVEHYEIAGYGAAAHYAKMLGEVDAARVLEEILEEEKRTDAILKELAIEMVSPEAIERSEGFEPERPSL